MAGDISPRPWGNAGQKTLQKKKKTPRVDGQKEPEKLIKILDMSITSGDDMSSTSRKS